MAKKNYDELAKTILKLIGDKENIVRFEHCMTRLRFIVKDKGIVNVKEIEKTEGILGTQWFGDQIQIIIGKEVEDVYLAVCEVAHIHPEQRINEVINNDIQEKDSSIKGIANQVISTITACVSPILIIFTVGGLLRLLGTLLGSTMLGILPDDHDLVVLLTMAGDACFRFFPIYIAYASAKKFDASIPLALILSCILLHPTLNEIVESGQKFTVYGIPMISTTYANSFLPALLNTWILAKVEKFFKKLFPAVVRDLLYPLCTLLVMLPLALCVLGPIGTVLGELLASFIMWLMTVLGPVATGLVGALFPLLIVTGMHHPLNSVALIEYLNKGYDSCILAGSYIMDFTLLALCFATLIKSKKATDKSFALSCIASEGIGGVSEPTIFGFMLKSKQNIAYVMIGGFFAGFYIGLFHVNCYVFAPAGIFSVLAYSGGSTANFVHGIIACVIAFIIPFVLSLIFGNGIEKRSK